MLIDQLRRLGIDTREEETVIRFLNSLSITEEQKREFIRKYKEEMGTARQPGARASSGEPSTG